MTFTTHPPLKEDEQGREEKRNRDERCGEWTGRRGKDARGGKRKIREAEAGENKEGGGKREKKNGQVATMQKQNS